MRQGVEWDDVVNSLVSIVKLADLTEEDLFRACGWATYKLQQEKEQGGNE